MRGIVLALERESTRSSLEETWMRPGPEGVRGGALGRRDGREGHAGVGGAGLRREGRRASDVDFGFSLVGFGMLSRREHSDRIALRLEKCSCAHHSQGSALEVLVDEDGLPALSQAGVMQQTGP